MRDKKIDVTVTEGQVTLATLSEPKVVDELVLDLSPGALNSAPRECE